MDDRKLKEFLLFVQDKTKIKSLELIEKDFYLNILLLKLNLEEYIFKGGTCLAKIYLNYHRLSEDLDFTFKNQELFKHKTRKQIKKLCKEKIDKFGKQLENLDFDFIFDKSNRKYVEIGSNNKLVTFKLWYKSLITDMPSFLKIQINFVDIVIFPVKKKELKPLITEKFSEEEKTYFQDFIKFYNKNKIFVYDIREILTEKFRSILTRRAMKVRDVIDLYFIYKDYKLKPERFIRDAKEKLIFVFNNYTKYKENFNLIKDEIQSFGVSFEEVLNFTIREIEKKEFDNFIKSIKLILNKIVGELE